MTMEVLGSGTVEDPFFKEDDQAGEVWSDSITRTRIIRFFHLLIKPLIFGIEFERIA